MKAEDKARFESGEFDREDWAKLWDRQPERMRHHTVLFVLQKLHAIESSGQFSFSWHYVTNEERDLVGGPDYDTEQPGDVITFKGRVVIGYR